MSEKAITLTEKEMNHITNTVCETHHGFVNCCDEIRGFVPEYYSEGALEDMTRTRDELQNKLCSWFDMLKPSVDVWNVVYAHWMQIDMGQAEKEEILKFISGLIDLRQNNLPVADAKVKMRAMELLFESIPTLDWYDADIARENQYLAEGQNKHIELPTYELSKKSKNLANQYGFLDERLGTLGAYVNKLNAFLNDGTESLNIYQKSQVAFIAGAAVCYGVYDYISDLAKTTQFDNAQKYGVELFGKDIRKIQQNIVPILAMVEAESVKAAQRKNTYVPFKDTEAVKIAGGFIQNYNIARTCDTYGYNATCSLKTRKSPYCMKCGIHPGMDTFYRLSNDPINKEYIFHRYAPLLRMEVLDLLPNNNFFKSLYEMVGGAIHENMYFTGSLKNVLSWLETLGHDYIIAPAFNLYGGAVRYDDKIFEERRNANIQSLEREKASAVVEMSKWYDMLAKSNGFMAFVMAQSKEPQRGGDSNPF